MTGRGSGTIRRTSPHARIARLALFAASLLVLLSCGAGTGSAAGDAGQPPVNRDPPRIDGTARVGQVLRAGPGRWRHARKAAFSYQWRLCDAAGTTCENVAGATDSIYAVRPADTARRVQVAVSVTTDAGGATAFSAPSPMVAASAAGAPLATARPTVGGTMQVGSVLTAGDGTWQGAQPIRIRYSWRRCAPQGGTCDDLGRTAQTYRISARDAGHALRVLVEAENAVAASAALSDPTAAIPGPVAPSPATAPENTAPPVISGTAAQGKTLTASSGTWSGTTPMSFRFQWLRCATDGDDCASISHGDRQAYALVAADVGHAIRVRVTARNSAGSASSTSEHTGVVAGAAAPVETSPPKVFGTARDGSVLSVSPGLWNGAKPIVVRYQWLRCAAAGGSCTSIPGATTNTRRLTSADVGHTLRARVTATNSGGSSAVLTGPSPVVASEGVAPANRAAPVLAGTPREGSRLSLSTGSWTGTQPMAFSYRWMRCEISVTGCRPIEGATGSTYVLTRADEGYRVAGVVTARNGAGSGSAWSNPTTTVIGGPVNRSLPTITGALVQGQTLTASPGNWAGTGSISFGFQWTRCDASGAFSTCRPIVVTSRPTYTLRATDVGHRILVLVKALDQVGASFVDSAQTAVVAAAPVVIPPPVATVTARAARSVVVYGGSVLLAGRVVGSPPGTRLAILERPIDQRARVLGNVGAIDDAGTWSTVVRPRARTTYRARVGGRVSPPTTVRVRPRLELRRLGPGRVRVRIFAARSFAGRTAFLQRWNPARHRWVISRRVLLHSTRMGLTPTDVTVAVFRTRTPRRTLVRVVLRHREAGPGYLTGISNRVRT